MEMLVPIVMVHVRVSSTVGIENLDTLKHAIVKLVSEHAETYGVRVKRRQISTTRMATLFSTYVKRVKRT